MAEGTVEWKLVLSIDPIVFTPAQEQFLTEFYRLCDRYRQAGIVSYSRGFVIDCYEVMVAIDLALPIKKDPDGTGLNRRV